MNLTVRTFSYIPYMGIYIKEVSIDDKGLFDEDVPVVYQGEGVS